MSETAPADDGGCDSQLPTSGTSGNANRLATAWSQPTTTTMLQPSTRSVGHHLWARRDGHTSARWYRRHDTMQQLTANGRPTGSSSTTATTTSGVAARGQSSCPEQPVSFDEPIGDCTAVPEVDASSTTKIVICGGSASATRSTNAGLAPHRRRRLILKSINRSWPTGSWFSASASSVGGGGNGGVTSSNGADGGFTPVAASAGVVAPAAEQRSRNSSRSRFEGGLSPRSPSPRDVASSSASTGQARPSPVGAAPCSVGGTGALRRESFLYRSDSDYEFSPMSLSRNSSLNANDAFIDDVIVTPFAQILHCLRRIWTNYIILNNISPARSRRASSKEKDHSAILSQLLPSLSDEQRQQLASETLEDLEWCLEQLETAQIDRSVSDLATNKFKRMLSRELTHFAESSKAGNEISEYICHTFLDKQQDVDLPTVCVEHVDGFTTSSSNCTETVASEECNGCGRGLVTSCSVDTAVGGRFSAPPRSPRVFRRSPSPLLLSSTSNSSTSSSPAPQVTSAAVGPAGSSSMMSSIHSRSGERSPLTKLRPSSAGPVLASLSTVVGSGPVTSRRLPLPPQSHQQPTVAQNGTDSPANVKEPPFLLSSSSVKTTIPKYGVDTSNNEAMSELLRGVDKWGLDVFKLSELTNCRPLTAVFYTIMQDRDLLNALRIQPTTLLNYVTLVESHYHSDVPYHNSIHASDVTQTAHVMLQVPALENVFTELETFAILFACAVHDVDHPGVNNHFLVQTGSDLALIYNDESVLENHHLAVAFKLLQSEGCDVLSELPGKQRQLLRRIAIDMVLATDMSKHMDHLAHLKTMVETRRISGNCEINMENYNERIQVMQNLIHCADLSNPAKPLDIYRQWTDRITREFHQQGDLERQLGMELSPMCDRHTASIDKSQIGFIDYIVQPLWETWSELVYPDCQDVLDALERNRSWCLEQISLTDECKQQQQPPQQQQQQQLSPQQDSELGQA